MLANKLIELAEEHWQGIAVDAVRRIRAEKDLRHMAKLSDCELKDWARENLKSLEVWAGNRDKDLAGRYEALGRQRFEQAIPLHEAIRALHILKLAMIEFVRGEGFGRTAVEVYSEEELEHRVMLFFDWLLYHLARGYDAAAGFLKEPAR
jgi:hypothetical protein